MAPDWTTKIRALAPAKLQAGVAAVTAATLIGGGAAYAILPTLESESIPAVPSTNDAALGLNYLSAGQTDVASRSGIDRATRDAARPEIAQAKPAVNPAELKKVAEGGSLSKITITAKPGKAWTTSSLRVRAEASAEAKEVAVLEEGSEVATTGLKNNDWAEITLDGKKRWVSGKYLTTTKPKVAEPAAAAGPSGSEPNASESTPSGSSKSRSSKSGSSSSSSSGSTSSSRSQSDGPAATGGSGSCRSQLPGLTSSARTLHNAICANYPSITSYGGVRSDSYAAHPSGRAIDAMIPNWESASGNGLGWSLANWLRANAGRFNIAEIIFDQTIWTSQRSGDGWRSMSDRGSANQNHRNHVHVAVK